MFKRISFRLAVVVPLLAWPGTGEAASERQVEASPGSSAVGTAGTVLSLSGEHLTIWGEPDGSRVLLFRGNFAARGTGPELKSQGAVIWLRQRRDGGVVHSHLRLYIEGNVRVTEPGGAVTEDQILITELQAVGELVVQAVERADGSKRDDPLYLRAVAAFQDSRVPEPPEVVKPEEPLEQPGNPDIDVGEEYSPAEETEKAVVPRPVGKERGPDVLEQGPLRISRGPIFMRGSVTTLQRANENIIILQADDRGQIYVSQGATKSRLLLEMQSDAAVVFQDAETLEQEGGQDETSARIGRSFTGVYLEGHVLVRQGERSIRAKKVYYDFRQDRALILDGVLRTIEKQRRVPIYVRAREIRQLSETEFLAKRATITSSDFRRPDYHLGTSKALLRDITPRDDQGRPTDAQRLYVQADNITFNVWGLPILWWPRVTGDFKRGETPLHTLKFAHSSNDGFIVETDWWLYRLLGLEEPENVKAILGLDYMSERGPVVRYEIDYLRDNYEGYSRGYLIDDHGEDQLGRSRDNLEPPRELRGRLLLRHRHYLPRDWEMQLEASYISDANWLEQFEESEFDTGKDQEAAIYLKKQRDNWAFSILANSRLMDFIDLTEHLPEARFVAIGQPLGGIATGFLDVRGGLVRRRASDEFGPPAPMESPEVIRGDARAEVELPLRLGQLKIVPYASARGTAWDDSPTAGGQQRYFLTAGVRGGTQFWRVYEKVRSRLLDLHQIRHIVQPQVHAFGTATNRDHSDLGMRLWPFDQEVEGLHDFSAVSVALLQTLQTKRGPAEERRAVDWLNLDVRATFFNRQDPYFAAEDFSDSAWPTNMARVVSRGRWVDYRPENSFPRDHVRADLSIRLSDTTLLFADAVYGMQPRGMDRVNVGLAVTRSPRLSYFIADRYDSALDMQVLTAGASYKINEKYTLAGAHQMDIDNGEGLSTGVSLVRKFPRWYMALTVDFDRGKDVSAVTLSIWPEGAPEVRIGARPVGRMLGGR